MTPTRSPRDAALGLIFFPISLIAGWLGDPEFGRAFFTISLLSILCNYLGWRDAKVGGRLVS